jgi:hypothetical protein
METDLLKAIYTTWYSVHGGNVKKKKALGVVDACLVHGGNYQEVISL